MTSFRALVFAALLGLTLGAACAAAQEQAPPSPPAKSEPGITLSGEMDDAMRREAAKVKEEFQQKALSLFDRRPLGWDFETIAYLYDLALSLPGRIPAFTRLVIEQSRVLGVIGSLLVLLFLAAVLYSLIGQRRVTRWVVGWVEPISAYIPEGSYPFVLSGIRIVASALLPLLLLGVFALINAMIAYTAAWFQLVGRLLGFWATGALLLRLLKETLTRDLFTVTAQYGQAIYRWARLALLYALFGIAVYWTAEVFAIREDVLALLRFAIAVSIIIVLLILHLNKKAFLSLVPDLPIRSYTWFRSTLKRYYFPLLLLSFLAALLWCFGYRTLGQLVLVKIWFTGFALVLVTVFYHRLTGYLSRWLAKMKSTDEEGHRFVGTLRSLLKYATFLVVAAIVLNMLGLLYPLQRLMSFPIFLLGETTITLWLILRAVLLLTVIYYLSRLAQAYFDYKVYPALGVDPGLGYALNTFFNYSVLGIGLLIVLNILGINLGVLLVFAGAIGVGVGLGLQNMAANVISGFTIIFGGKIRKGDWIEVESMIGQVTDIYLRATRVRTRDNIEYLVPNSNIIANTMVNYSLSSPLIRIELPVGVAYSADPRQVETILLNAAQDEPEVDQTHRPAVRFVAYGDNSINFELLFWIDVRSTPRRRVRSNLYFAIFEALAEAGIEIPFPQRDIHIRSQAPSP